ncbi:hypothetical protein H6G00_01415 [Leptolyngbya sp. FACHB-541]|uniref:hypothetical protein n=1 Tax=Leptolyngbya sp. FACHB-541 TaxID=2692810 RepID=UPI0016888430|nr:hypothetical protein [Leptolyngbya sp. FACHB-541]MBD1995288.1 hypothetical protein [Leptolyngbya sp. FACHB-541]
MIPTFDEFRFNRFISMHSTLLQGCDFWFDVASRVIHVLANPVQAEDLWASAEIAVDARIVCAAKLSIQTIGTLQESDIGALDQHRLQRFKGFFAAVLENCSLYLSGLDRTLHIFCSEPEIANSLREDVDFEQEAWLICAASKVEIQLVSQNSVNSWMEELQSISKPAKSESGETIMPTALQTELEVLSPSTAQSVNGSELPPDNPLDPLLAKLKQFIREEFETRMSSLNTATISQETVKAAVVEAIGPELQFLKSLKSSFSALGTADIAAETAPAPAPAKPKATAKAVAEKPAEQQQEVAVANDSAPTTALPTTFKRGMKLVKNDWNATIELMLGKLGIDKTPDVAKQVLQAIANNTEAAQPYLDKIGSLLPAESTPRSKSNQLTRFRKACADYSAKL